MNIDKAADPCQNFYQYACGNWAEEHPIPKDYLSLDYDSIGDDRIAEKLRNFFKRNNSKDTTEPLPVKQTRLLYSACMDTDAMNTVGYETVRTFMKKIGFPSVPQFFKRQTRVADVAKLLG